MGRGGVIIGSPLVKMIGDIKGKGIGRGVLKVNNDELERGVNQQVNVMEQIRTRRCSGMPSASLPASLKRFPY